MNTVIPQLASIDVLGRPITLGDCIILFTFATGFHFNVENLIKGFMGAKDKTYALAALMPYACFFVMMISSSYSRLTSGLLEALHLLVHCAERTVLNVCDCSFECYDYGWA